MIFAVEEEPADGLASNKQTGSDGLILTPDTLRSNLNNNYVDADQSVR